MSEETVHSMPASDAHPRRASESGRDEEAARSHDGVLALIADVERMLGTLRTEAEQDLGRAGEAERLSAEVASLRAELAAQVQALEDAEAAHAGREQAIESDLRTDFERRLESLRIETESDRAALRARGMALEAELAALSNTLADTIAARDTAIRRLEEERHALLESECRARSSLAAASAEIDALRARIAEPTPVLTDEHAGLVHALGDAESRAEQAAAEAERSARRIAELEERLAQASTASAETSVAGPADPGAACDVSEEAIARAVEDRVQQVLKPRLAQLAQVAQFLKVRKTRLAALRRGLRRRARAQQALRQIYSNEIAGAEGSVPSAAAPVAAAVAHPHAIEGADALAAERRELEDLRTILAASEQALARRAAGTRLVTTTALASAFLAVAAALSWHVAGAVAPPPALATVDLVVASRAPEAQRDAESPDAKPVADWLSAHLADERFVGVVAGRLGDLGRTAAESAALVDRLADRVTVASDGPHVRLALRGSGPEATVATLDAVATATVQESNRLPERRSDFLRIAIANAGQEVGRAVFAKSAPLPDPDRLGRAGIAFGALAAAGALVAGLLHLAGRRAARLAAAPS